jgi:hypothetical protein
MIQVFPCLEQYVQVDTWPGAGYETDVDKTVLQAGGLPAVHQGGNM